MTNEEIWGNFHKLSSEHARIHTTHTNQVSFTRQELCHVIIKAACWNEVILAAEALCKIRESEKQHREEMEYLFSEDLAVQKEKE